MTATASQVGVDAGAWPWDGATIEHVLAEQDADSAADAAVIAEAVAMLGGRQEPDAARLMAAFLRGTGSRSDPDRFALSHLATEVGRRQGILTEQESFFHHPWQPARDAVAMLCPDLLPLMFQVQDPARAQAVRLLDRCPNESRDRSFPAAIDPLIHTPVRPGLIGYAAEDALAYIHPFCTQMLSADAHAMWLTGSPRFLSRTCLDGVARAQVDRTIVIVQDRFNFTNLSHFLYDGITRVLHYARRFGIDGSELFVFGGIPTDYHVVICEALIEHIGVTRDSIFFPRRAQLLRGRRCVWFSDQIEGHTHPAQMAHPDSIRALAQLCRRIAAPVGEARRIYVSRTDAKSRRVLNEAELTAALAERGFVTVELGSLAAVEQISLFRGADIVVGPHGQGMTHLVQGQRLGRVIELFGAHVGTACYAWMARGMGIDYRFVIGTAVPDTPADFTVDVAQVMAMLADETAITPPCGIKPANLIPSSRSFGGFQPTGASAVPGDLQMMWGQQAIAHGGGSGDMIEAGAWPGIEVIPGLRYTLSCWIWIPSAVSVRAIELALSGCGEEERRSAAVTQVATWQRLSTTATAPASGWCRAALLIAAAGDGVLSTCWQLEAGPVATTYVPTP